MSIFWACLLCLILCIGWGLNLLALPGNWINCTATACYAWWMPADDRISISWPVVGVVVVLAISGELVELLASAAGAAKAGGSRRSAVLGILGAILGSFLGALIGLPIPILGSVAGALLFASVGALAGAILGEQWKGRDWETVWNVGQAAFWGRLVGTLGKVLVGAVMVVVVLAALVLQ